jgi:hypothetical protein
MATLISLRAQFFDPFGWSKYLQSSLHFDFSTRPTVISPSLYKLQSVVKMFFDSEKRYYLFPTQSVISALLKSSLSELALRSPRKTGDSGAIPKTPEGL